MTAYIIFALSATIVILLLLAVAYFWLRRKTYTRERFAFVAFSACGAGFVLLANAVMANATPMQQLAAVVSYFQTGKLVLSGQLNSMTAITLVVLYGILCWLALLFFDR